MEGLKFMNVVANPHISFPPELRGITKL